MCLYGHTHIHQIKMNRESYVYIWNHCVIIKYSKYLYHIRFSWFMGTIQSPHKSICHLISLKWSIEKRTEALVIFMCPNISDVLCVHKLLSTLRFLWCDVRDGKFHIHCSESVRQIMRFKDYTAIYFREGGDKGKIRWWRCQECLLRV